MKILFDVLALQPSQGKYHGAGEYGKALLFALVKYRNEETIHCFYNSDKWLDPMVIEFIRNNDLPLFEIRSNRDIGLLIEKEQYDRVYSALPYKLYDIDFSKSLFIFTIHGLRDLENAHGQV